MKSLRVILCSNWLFYFIGGVSIAWCLCCLFFSFSFTKLSFDDEKFTGIVDRVKFDGNQMTLEVLSKERVVAFYYARTEDELEKLKETYQLGDRVQLLGHLEVPSHNRVFYLFNYHHYLLSKKVFWVFQIEQIKKLQDRRSVLYEMKYWFQRRISQIGDKTGYLEAFILGNNSMVDGNMMEAYRQNGVSHLFAVSGMHVSLLCMVFLWLLRRFFYSENVCSVILILFFLFYLFLTGFSPSIMRAVFLFILLRINKIFDLGITPMKALGYVFFGMLFWNPYVVYSVGFQFSFIVSFFLIRFQKWFCNCSYFQGLFRVSALSFLAGCPILLYHFFTVNGMSVLFNLLMVPLVSFVVFPFCFVVFLFPFFVPVLSFLIGILEGINRICMEFDFFLFSFPRLCLVFYVVYYVFIYLLFYLHGKKRKCVLFVFIILVIGHYFSGYFRSDFMMTMVDVGQGDAILVSLPYQGGNILIDTGGVVSFQKEWQKKKRIYSIAEDTLIPYFYSMGIRKLDYFIISHGDYDHMGEAIHLVSNFKVEKVIFNCGELNDLEQDLIQVLDKKKIPYYSCIKELNIDDSKLYFLNYVDYGNENDNSSVIYTKFNHYKFLFMGDAGSGVEENLIKQYNLQDIDVLKVGHHGSKMSSSKKFIDEINPRYSIISVGKNNRYRHPNDSVLDRLINSKIYRTDLDGSIMFRIKNNEVQIKTCVP